ncbi:MAG: GNAT family N-acetyltransferase [Actinomycetes bacterium]
MAPVDPIELKDDDLLLRPWQEGDVDAVFRACQDQDIQRWTCHVPSPYTRQDAQEFVGGSPAQWADGTPSCAIVDAVSGELLGSMGVADVTSDGDAEIGYWVAASARGRGVATRATRLIAAWLFECGSPRITWRARVGNLISRRVAESAGFVVEGTARQGMACRGERVDVWVASLLPADLERAGKGEKIPTRLLTGWPLSPVELRSERLLLRASRESDAPALLAYAKDPVAAIWDPEDTPDLEAAKERARRRADWASGDIAVWVIADPDDSVVLGGIQLFDVATKSLHAMVGYGLMAEARGHGYGAEALRTVTEWAFNTTNLNRIALMHAVENQASCAVARAAGFALEGTMRQSYRFGDAHLHNEHLHARLREDSGWG